MKFKFLSCLIGALLVAGCASDVANRYYSRERFAPNPIASVKILTTNPDRPFTVIADFQSRGESPEDLRKKAAEIGADAIIVSLLGGYISKDEQWAGADRFSKTYARITGTAIRFN